MMSFNIDQNYWAACYANEKALIIQTYSGLRMTRIDHLCPPYVLPPNIDDKVLGNILLAALENSRTFIYGNPDYEDFVDIDNFQQRYNEWTKNLCDILGYKTKRSLLKRMIRCSIWLVNGRIEINPSRHIKLEVWDSIDAEDVILSLNNTAEEIGVGLRLALSRCA